MNGFVLKYLSGIVNVPSSYALAATLAAMWADIFLMLENGGYMSPLSKFSCVTSAARASAVADRTRQKEIELRIKIQVEGIMSFHVNM